MSLAGKTICFTGTLTMKRTDATKAAEAAGAIVGGSVTGKTNILVAGPGAGAKADQAKAKGVEVWTEDEFMAALGLYHAGGGAASSSTGPATGGGASSSSTGSAVGKKKATAPAEKEDAPTPKKPKVAKSAPSTPIGSTSSAAPGATPTGLRSPGVDRYARDFGANVYLDFDAKLNQAVVDGPVNSNKFYVLQVLQRGSLFACWNRWGRVGEAGQNNSNKLEWGTLETAVADFEKKFKDKSGK
jgi:predicted DNA-binding WGR domain protein